MTGSEKSLILGAYAHYPPEMLEPFARSLRATGFRGSFHVIAAGYTPEQLTRLETLADRVRGVDDDYEHILGRTIALLRFTRTQRGLRRFYPALFEAVARVGSERNSFRRWRSLEFRLEGLQSLRYLHYHRHLIEDAPDAELVMITDLRDVVFQGDPFAELLTGLELYLEDDSEKIGKPGFNTRWLRDLYGSDFVGSRRGQPFSCSGTVIGTRAAMLHYLSEMVAGIVWRRLPMGPHDQGVHNGLIQTGRLPAAKLVQNEHGRVITLGRMLAPRVSSEGLVLNADGSVPAVVHQWDRHPSLLTSLSALST